jgi:hypothetical protein
MNFIKNKPNLKLIIIWLVANAIAWPLGILLAIILSYAIVNIFHPEETNLIIGFSTAITIGFAQWKVLKKLMTISMLWIVAPGIGIGFPYAWVTINVESGNNLPLLLNTEWVFMALLFFICGAFVGLIQSRLKSINTGKSYIWILLSGIAWSISITLNSFLFSGLIIGLATLAAFIFILKERKINS